MATKYNKNITGIAVTDEIVRRTSTTAARLAHDTFIASTVVVRTAASGGGTLLSLGTDYTLGGEDTRLTTEAGATVYTTLAVVNGAYHATNLYVTYSTVGDYAEAEDSVPAGTMSMYAGASAPVGWLLCDGSAVNRAQYVSLFQNIGTTWGSGDGSTTFNVPDMRGAAPAGVGTSSGYTQNETYALGSKYNDQEQGHRHDMSLGGYIYSSLGYSNASGGISQLGSGSTQTSIVFVVDPVSDGVNGPPRVGNVTRGKRVGVNFIIKY